MMGLWWRWLAVLVLCGVTGSSQQQQEKSGPCESAVVSCGNVEEGGETREANRGDGAKQQVENCYKHEAPPSYEDGSTEENAAEDCKHHVPSSGVRVEKAARGDLLELQTLKTRQVEFGQNGGKSGGNILVLHPIFGGSHERAVRGVGEVLVERGHRVTQIRWRSSLSKEINSTVKVITLSPDNSDLRWVFRWFSHCVCVCVCSTLNRGA